MCETSHNGDVSRLLFLSFALTVSYLQGDLLEDFFFGDMGKWGGVWHNWGTFMPTYTILILSYSLMHLKLGHPEHGAWRSPNSSLLDFVVRSGQSPFKWPTVMYDENEVELLPVVIVANATFALVTLYYQVLWKFEIKGTRTEYGLRLKNCLISDCVRCEKDFTKIYTEKFKQEHSTVKA